MIKKLFKKYFDYKIVGLYLEATGTGTYKTKYKRKYYFKKWRK